MQIKYESLARRLVLVMNIGAAKCSSLVNGGVVPNSQMFYLASLNVDILF